MNQVFPERPLTAGHPHPPVTLADVLAQTFPTMYSNSVPVNDFETVKVVGDCDPEPECRKPWADFRKFYAQGEANPDNFFGCVDARQLRATGLRSRSTRATPTT